MVCGTKRDAFVRPFLIQSDFSSRKRPFSTQAQIELSYTVEKGLFLLNFFDQEFRLADPVENLSRKSFTPVF